MSTAQETPQLGEWRGEFGREYTIRNCLTPQQVDALWVKNYGVTRTEAEPPLPCRDSSQRANPGSRMQHG